MGNFLLKKDTILTNKEQKIMEYIYQNAHTVAALPIGELAKELKMSVATLSRFVRHIGYKSYKEMRLAIAAYHQETTPAGKLQTALNGEERLSISQLLLQQEMYLAKTRENLNEEDMQKVVEAILKAPTIYLFGKGAARGLSELLAFRLKRFDKRVVILEPSGSSIFEELVHVKKEDVVLIFGFSKLPIEAKVILDYKKEVGYQTILILDGFYRQAEKADLSLYVDRGEENAFHSMTAPTALVDAIVLLVGKALEQESLQSLLRLYTLKQKYKKQIPR
jgi:DNA-binding MurR/RpiR family transcriptional regulator